MEECHDYDILKQALFTAYSRVHEFCRNLTSKELLKPSKYKDAGQHTVIHSVVALLLQIPVVEIQVESCVRSLIFEVSWFVGNVEASSLRGGGYVTYMVT